MTISLPLYVWLLLLVGISALSGSIGALLVCCVKVGKKPDQRWLPLAERRGMQPGMRVQEGAAREYDAICRSAYRQRGAEEDGFCLGDMV